MDLQTLIQMVKEKGASDLHLEPGLPPAARIQGELKSLGKDPLEPRETGSMARALLNDSEWEAFLARWSFDLSCVLSRVRCRVSIMRTSRGVGLAVRLLSSFQPTLDRLNLLPDLAKLVKRRHGLIVVSGPTGSGKSSTLAALLHEINIRENHHIVTIESPIEYPLLPRRCFVRQREVGRDTPSFDRALIDAMRQDPDVIMVGEMRERETIRLTLSAAETGQLVLSTLHSSNTTEALQRMVAAFPAEIQGSVCIQIADCLIAVVAQRLSFNAKYGIRVPLCEILVANNPARNLIRQGQFFKLPSVLETAFKEGCWTFRRYQQWLESREALYVPTGNESLDTGPPKEEAAFDGDREAPAEIPGTKRAPSAKSERGPVPAETHDPNVSEDVIVIEEPEEKSLSDLLKKLDPE